MCRFGFSQVLTFCGRCTLWRKLESMSACSLSAMDILCFVSRSWQATDAIDDRPILPCDDDLEYDTRCGSVMEEARDDIASDGDSGYW